MSKQYTPEVIHLRDRVRLGNEKLNRAFDMINQISPSSDERKEKFEEWHQANERLSNLCTELKLKGYVDCLYLDSNGKKIRKCFVGLGCRVCPSNTPFWEMEFDEIPSASGKRSSGGPEQMEVFKTL